MVRREGARTGLIVDVVDGDGRWRYLEDLPPPVLLTEADVAAAGPLLRDALWTAVQLQQPPEAVRAAVGLARGNRIVLDGAPSEDDRDELLAAAFAVRAVVPLDETPVADTTGAGDALTAALVAALARGSRRSAPSGSRSRRPAPPSATPEGVPP
ncbi:hypothetical protein ABZ914_38950 [Spirillospora sp. NPDC046719]